MLAPSLTSISFQPCNFHKFPKLYYVNQTHKLKPPVNAHDLGNTLNTNEYAFKKKKNEVRKQPNLKILDDSSLLISS